ncbi:MAG TPA: response regulator [Vicinamibacterales bacterium]|nr:response regulator [Vicinamibacterales bacterium]
MTLRVVIVDDERPARKFLAGLLEECEGVEIVGEAASGEEAITLIVESEPDLAFLDLQMPEVGGLEVVRQLPPAALPGVAFVTAFDEFAVEAFELNAVDYLLKPVELARLVATLDRARDRLARAEPPEDRAKLLDAASQAYQRAASGQFLERIPVRRRDDILILPVRQIASIVAEAELLHITTTRGDRYTITYRLHLLERRLDPARFIRLSRGALVNVDLVTKVTPMPGGTAVVTLVGGQELGVSRIQCRVLRETLLKL